MKQFFRHILFVAVVLLSVQTKQAFGQIISADLSVGNHFSSNDTVYFDIFLAQSSSSQDPTFLSHSEFVFDYDESQFTNPTVGVATHTNGSFYSTITTSTGVTNIMYDYGTVPSLGEVPPNDNRIIIDLAAPNFNESSAGDFEAKVARINKGSDQILGRFFISGYNGGTSTIGLTWVTSGAENEMRTQVSSYDSTSYESDHISLNFDVIGGLMQEVMVSATVILEGPYNGTDMNTDLNTLNLIPLTQPYNGAPWNYSGTESVASIPNSNVVDWVHVCIREANGPNPDDDPSNIVARRSAFLLKDGSIVDVDGVSPVSFGFIEFTYSNIFAEVYHRNHLPVVGTDTMSLSGGVYSYDFSISISQIFHGAQGGKSLSGGKGGMATGDGNGDGEVLGSDRNIWAGSNGGSGVYSAADMNMDGEILGSDRNAWLPNNGLVEQIP